MPNQPKFTLEEVLRPLATRFGPRVNEHEILRVAASIYTKEGEDTAAEARRQVLAWAQRRSGGRLPPEAWAFEPFEYFAGGRNSMGVRLRRDVADIWAIRADDPDKDVAGRVWTTEVVIGVSPGLRPRFSVRLLVGTGEDSFRIEPHTPGLVQQVSENCGLSIGPDDLDTVPWAVENDHETYTLIDRLLDQERNLPVIVLSVNDSGSNQNETRADAKLLARAVLGIAQVVVISSDQTWALGNRLGRTRSVYGGAVRLYLPGFSEDSDPFQHRLFLADQLITPSDRARVLNWLRAIVAADSVRRNRIGRDVLAFSAIRNATLQVRHEQLSSEGASESAQLVAANERIGALETELESERAALLYFDDEARQAQERADVAETQLRAATYHVSQLQNRIRSAGAEIDEELPDPQTWAGFADWCDTHFVGRVALTAAARRGAKDATFEDIALVGRCVTWLATDYRDGRINGAGGGFRDFSIESGVRNSPCGGDEFEAEWQGRKHTADWHIKNGGNTRDPQRCLRIYYFWEPETQQVIIVEMPYHRRTAVS